MEQGMELVMELGNGDGTGHETGRWVWSWAWSCAWSWAVGIELLHKNRCCDNRRTYRPEEKSINERIIRIVEMKSFA